MTLLLSSLMVYSFSCDGSKSFKTNTSTVKSGNDSLKIEVFADNMYVPWSIVFTDGSRCLVAERNGKLRVIENGKLLEQPVKEFSEVSTESEEGLMGLTLDPDYKSNKLIYLSYAYQLQGMQAFQKEGDLLVKVVRYKDNGKSLSDEKIIFDGIPATHLHAGCRIKFGPDNKLYITTGDATDRKLAQDLKSMLGKILRINSDGTIPDDNPFEATDDLRGAERRGNLSNFKNNFFFGCLRGEGIMRVVIDDKDPTKVISFEKICRDYGRIRDVAEGPDGAIYFSTSNRDGRGSVREGDDKIYRITSK